MLPAWISSQLLHGRSPGPLRQRWHSDAKVLLVAYISLAKCFVRFKCILARGKFPWNEEKNRGRME